jgi:hypothetical protein
VRGRLWGNLTNGHNESPLYNEYILIKLEKVKEKIERIYPNKNGKNKNRKKKSLLAVCNVHQ